MAYLVLGEDGSGHCPDIFLFAAVRWPAFFPTPDAHWHLLRAACCRLTPFRNH